MNKSKILFFLSIVITFGICYPKLVQAREIIQSFPFIKPTSTPIPTPTPTSKFLINPNLNKNIQFSTIAPASTTTPTVVLSPTDSGEALLSPTDSPETTIDEPETDSTNESSKSVEPTAALTTNANEGKPVTKSNNTTLYILFAGIVVILVIQIFWPKIKQWLHDHTV